MPAVGSYYYKDASAFKCGGASTGEKLVYKASSSSNTDCGQYIYTFGGMTLKGLVGCVDMNLVEDPVDSTKTKYLSWNGKLGTCPKTNATAAKGVTTLVSSIPETNTEWTVIASTEVSNRIMNASMASLAAAAAKPATSQISAASSGLSGIRFSF